MRIYQYAYFALYSRHMPASEMSSRLGMEPDEIVIRGSKVADPPVPVSHVWRVVCRKPGLSVDEQIGQVVDRLLPNVERIALLAAELAAVDSEHDGAGLQIVRRFTAEEDEDPQNLLGWHLSLDVVKFMAATGAGLDVDEYDYL
jgi:hypothetical protein